MPIGIIHVAAIRVGQFKFNTGQRLLRHRIQLSDDNGPGKLVPEGQGLDLTLLDEDTLRRASSTYPSAVLVSRAVTVVPGVKPEMTTLPSAPVV